MPVAHGVAFEHVVKEYQTGKRVVDDVSFDVSRGEFVVLLGPSGCGKTTLLKSVNRLVDLSTGIVRVDGMDIRAVEPTALRRGIGYVIQQIGLFPHMTIAENVAVVPSLVGWPRERIAVRVAEMLELVGLPQAKFGARFPAALSGGQQQRIGLARALAADPAIMLMDEPFGALDAIERSRLQGELLALQRQLRRTVLFVTHDVDEALRLADRIVVMREGHVVQHATPLEIIARPADAFVAELVGAGDLVRMLGLMHVGDVPLLAVEPSATGAPLPPESDLRSALSRMLDLGTTSLSVADSQGRMSGTLTFEHMVEAAHAIAGRQPS